MIVHCFSKSSPKDCIIREKQIEGQGKFRLIDTKTTGYSFEYYSEAIGGWVGLGGIVGVGEQEAITEFEERITFERMSRCDPKGYFEER